MDLMKGKILGKKKGLILRTWERWRYTSRPHGAAAAKLKTSKSWPPPSGRAIAASASDDDDEQNRRVVAPQGCFSVYVGAQKQRFCVKTDCLNHPLFRMLLEEAESEYGYNTAGPLQLPCDVDRFIEVLVEIDCDDGIVRPAAACRCSLSRTYSSYHQLLPASLRLLA